MSRDGVLPIASTKRQVFPVGFPGAVTLGGGGSSGPAAGVDPIGTVSPKIYLKHPAGVPKYVLDESPEAEVWKYY